MRVPLSDRALQGIRGLGRSVRVSLQALSSSGELSDNYGFWSEGLDESSGLWLSPLELQTPTPQHQIWLQWSIGSPRYLPKLKMRPWKIMYHTLYIKGTHCASSAGFQAPWFSFHHFIIGHHLFRCSASRTDIESGGVEGSPSTGVKCDTPLEFIHSRSKLHFNVKHISNPLGFTPEWFKDIYYCDICHLKSVCWSQFRFTHSQSFLHEQKIHEREVSNSTVLKIHFGTNSLPMTIIKLWYLHFVLFPIDILETKTSSIIISIIRILGPQCT